jgi:DNA polymerase elongation subunit (family B)
MKKFYTNIQQLGDKLFVRSVEDGERIREEIHNFQPTLFAPEKKSKYRTIDGKPVGPVNPGSITECKNFIKMYADVPGFEVYGSTEWVQQYIYETFKSTDHDISKVRICTIDIEVESEHGFPDVENVNERVNLISIKDSLTGRCYVMGLQPFYTDRDDVSYLLCDGEEELLRKFQEFFVELKPDIITGWNCKWYDMPYLIRRMKTMFDNKFINKLSPWNRVKERTKKTYRFAKTQVQEEIYYQISGVAILDSLDMYKKFTYTNRESYSLDYIGKVEVDEAKLDWHEMGYSSHKDVYKNDWKTWVEYNIQDVELVEKINNKLNLIELILQTSYDAGVNYEDVSSPVRMWDSIIYKHLRDRNVVIPTKKGDGEKREYEGGYVKDPQIGAHDWVVSFDLNSLYPHLIMQYNISPETLMDTKKLEYTVEDYLNQKSIPEYENQNVTANGYYYSTDKQGFLGVLMEWMYDDRTKYKDLLQKAKQNGDEHLIAKYDTIQMARKIALNSAYGALANEYFRYYDIRLAESITKSGQLAIRWIEKELNQYLNEVMDTKDKDYVVASDTDSVYLVLGDLVSKFLGSVDDKNKIVDVLDSFCKDKIQPAIDEAYQKLADYMNAYQQRMVMDREVIADKGLWTAKKRYILNVYDNEGNRNDEPELKIMGIESQRSSTPSVCRDKIKESLKIILRGTEEEIQKYISDFKDEFFDMSPEVIASPRSVSGMDKYSCSAGIYQKGTPIHTKGSLLYNHWVKNKGLDDRYELINEGDKIKFTYLKEPNVINDRVISFPSRLPNELGLQKYVDYETQFEKCYIDPITTVLDTIDWKHEKISTLEDFFGGI